MNREVRIRRALEMRATLKGPPAGFRWVTEDELRAQAGDPVGLQTMAGAMIATVSYPFGLRKPRLRMVGGLWHLCEFDWVNLEWVSLGSGFSPGQAYRSAREKGWIEA